MIVINVAALLEMNVSRLECLQSEIGLNKHDGKWISNRNIHGGVLKETPNTHWFYQLPKCHLTFFNEKSFCQEALKCRSLLIVGDSTTYTMVEITEHIFNVKIATGEPCPTSNGCWGDNKNDMCNDDAPNHIKLKYRVQHFQVCGDYCVDKVLFTYMRNSVLPNHHGKEYFREHQCDFWRNIVHKYGYFLVNIGPHIPTLIEHPYGRNKSVENDDELRSILRREASELANIFLNITRKVNKKLAPVMIYQTGHWGAVNWDQGNCDTPPLKETPVTVISHPPALNEWCDINGTLRLNDTASGRCYYWDKIPILNTVFKNTLRKELPRDKLLILDTANLYALRPHCRVDYIHFIDSKHSFSPQYMTWHLLQNLLVEYHRNVSMSLNNVSLSLDNITDISLFKTKTSESNTKNIESLKVNGKMVDMKHYHHYNPSLDKKRPIKGKSL